MANDNIFTGVLGALIILGLIVLIVIEATTPTKVQTESRTEILPIPYPSRNYHPPYHPPYNPPYNPPNRPNVPTHVVGDRSNPFCEHTKHGCYPGTTTPIP